MKTVLNRIKRLFFPVISKEVGKQERLFLDKLRKESVDNELLNADGSYNREREKMNIRQASKINKKTIGKNNYTKNQLNKAQQILHKWALKEFKT